MAGSFSNYLENALLDHVFKNTAFSQPTNLYVALYTVAPSDSGGGTEVTGGSYVRKTFNDWGDAANGALSNASAITFDKATASWGTVVAFAILDAPTGGNFLVWGDLTTPKAIGANDTAEFAAGDLSVTLD